jgi:hypothetical protein
LSEADALREMAKEVTEGVINQADPAVAILYRNMLSAFAAGALEIINKQGR